MSVARNFSTGILKEEVNDMPKETSAFNTYSLIFKLKKKHLYFKKKHQEVIIIAEILREFHGNTVFPKIIAIPRVINSLK